MKAIELQSWENVSVLLFFTSQKHLLTLLCSLQDSHIDAVQSQCYLFRSTLLIAIYYPTPQLHNIRTSLSSRFPVFTNWYQLCISNLKHILNYRCFLFKLTLNLNNFISSFKFIFSSTSAGTTTLGRPSSPLSLTSLLNDRTTVSFSLYSVLHSTISVTFIPHISDHFPLLLKVFPWHLFVFQFISELFCIFHSNFKTCLVPA